MQRESTSEADSDQNKPKLYSFIKTEYGFKIMPRSHKGHKFILCIIDEVTNYLITLPIHQAKSEEVGEALIENVITKYYVPEYINMDLDSAFMSSLMTYLLHKFNIKINNNNNNNNNNKFIYIPCIIKLTKVIPSMVYNSKIDKVKL